MKGTRRRKRNKEGGGGGGGAINNKRSVGLEGRLFTVARWYS